MNPLPVAVQLYTLRALPFDAQLAAVAEAGYRAVETVGTHGLAAADMRAALAERGLQVISSHLPLDVLEQQLEEMVAFAREVGNDTLVVPWLAQEARPRDAEGWTKLGARLGELGRDCRQHGVSLLYHNHDFEMARLGDKTALEHLLDAADPDHLGLELDLAWVVRGGEDPLPLLEKYAGRCPRVHVKDLSPPGENEAEDGWADVGHGTLDWPVLLPAAKAAGATWLIVEHDRPRDPAASIRRSRRYLQNALT
jgi:sugar phosphate isomerase/epimerase